MAYYASYMWDTMHVLYIFDYLVHHRPWNKVTVILNCVGDEESEVKKGKFLKIT